MCWSGETREGGTVAPARRKSNKEKNGEKERGRERVDVPEVTAAVGADDGHVLSVVIFHCCSKVCV